MVSGLKTLGERLLSLIAVEGLLAGEMFLTWRRRSKTVSLQLPPQHADHVVGGNRARELVMFIDDRKRLQIVLVK